MNDITIIIPSRLAAERLPNKPLKLIKNKEMIVHVYEAAKSVNIGKVYVATPDKKIIDLINSYGGNAVETHNDHHTGTDRVFEVFDKTLNQMNVAEELAEKKFDENVQNEKKMFIFSKEHNALYESAYKIFLDNKILGVGVKNFRNESPKKKYENKEYLLTSRRYATHPHQIHYEFLSETGLFGYLSFLIFLILSLALAINRYLKIKNLYQLSGIIFVISSVLPILPSGSFLSTFSGGIFWINYAIMCGYISKTKY